ncbi:MAG: hypothetical protein AAF490_00455 [Chloroflexota bacterium]
MTQTSALAEQLWQAVIAKAHEGGLDPEKFNENHRQIITLIAEFLNSIPSSKGKKGRSSFLGRLFGRQGSQEKAGDETAVQTVPPIIISGIPGTGKTTFLYLIDAVLRTQHQLPDNIQTVMTKRDGTTYSLQKRFFCGMAVSLLSVRKWTELLYFYNWDVETHGFNPQDLSHFIQNTLLPMRILFADEVEMTGYSPTLPDLAKHGILVIGTSNQYEFAQLDSYLIPPQIYQFSGEDMRLGNPSDAIVTEIDKGWTLFQLTRTRETQFFEKLAYQRMMVEETAVVQLQFDHAITVPMLESDWIRFLQSTAPNSTGDPGAFPPNTPYILLLEQFSLAQLQGNFDAIIRFVTLFDVVEQFGIGVLIRNVQRTPRLSPDAIQQMKISIKTRAGVDPEVRKRTAAGIDRWLSRLGQAGNKANLLL